MWRLDWAETGLKPPTPPLPSWLPALLAFVFSTGLQLSGATQHCIGYGLMAISVLGGIAWAILSRYTKRENRWTLLESQLTKINNARVWLTSQDEPDRSMPFDEDRVFQWASGTYDLITVEFPAFADAFMGGDLVPLGPPFFATAYMDYLHAHGRGDYLEDRAAIVQSILCSRGGRP